MKNNLTNILVPAIKALLIIIIFSSISCKQEKMKEKEIAKQTVSWDSIKDSADFISFLEFALNPNDTNSLEQCYDSLTKYMPKRECEKLFCHKYFDTLNNKTSDYSFSHDDFDCNGHSMYDTWNRVEIAIDSIGKVYTNYKQESYNNFQELLYLLHTAQIESNLLSDSILLEYCKKEYVARTIHTWIRCYWLQMESVESFNWKKLLYVIKELQFTMEKLLELKSEKIFGTAYNELDNDKKEFIDRIVRPSFTIEFCFYCPPPPSPIKIDE